MRYNFAIVGLGKVGSALLFLFSRAGHVPQWAVSSVKKGQDIRVYSGIPKDPEGANVVILAVPDRSIADVAAQIAQTWQFQCRGIVFFHLSGLHSAKILSPLENWGGEIASLHPLQSIMDISKACQELKQSFFTVEGTTKAESVARELVTSIGSTLGTITPEDKVVYHTAAVVASNFLVALLSQATELMTETGLGREHLMPLVRGTLTNIEEFGSAALTGPVQRGDWDTLRAHLALLRERFPDLLTSYLCLADYTARLAGKKLPDEFLEIPKIFDSTDLAGKIESMKKRGMRVVFTNGCFDILHAGHVSYLKKARACGDCLVVGLNSDASVRRLKGLDRPVNNQKSRACVLSALSCVDMVTVFEQDTPLELIKLLRPHVLVKGGDWKIDEIVGGDVVMADGGQVVSLEFEEGYSTTSILDRIKKPHCES